MCHCSVSSGLRWGWENRFLTVAALFAATCSHPPPASPPAHKSHLIVFAPTVGLWQDTLDLTVDWGESQRPILSEPGAGEPGGLVRVATYLGAMRGLYPDGTNIRPSEMPVQCVEGVQYAEGLSVGGHERNKSWRVEQS